MALKGKTRKKCAVKGCRKRVTKYSVYCLKHCLGRDQPNETPNQAVGVLTALCAAVAAKYRAEGDVTKAGVVLAELSHEPPRFYASVARYPEGPMKKQIVLQVGRSFGEAITTAEEAVNTLAQKFAGENRPAQVRKRLVELDAVLGIEDEDNDGLA